MTPEERLVAVIRLRQEVLELRSYKRQVEPLVLSATAALKDASDTMEALTKATSVATTLIETLQAENEDLREQVKFWKVIAEGKQ